MAGIGELVQKDKERKRQPTLHIFCIWNQHREMKNEFFSFESSMNQHTQVARQDLINILQSSYLFQCSSSVAQIKNSFLLVFKKHWTSVYLYVKYLFSSSVLFPSHNSTQNKLIKTEITFKYTCLEKCSIIAQKEKKIKSSFKCVDGL